jgi:hypothetical protein
VCFFCPELESRAAKLSDRITQGKSITTISSETDRTVSPVGVPPGGILCSGHPQIAEMPVEVIIAEAPVDLSLTLTCSGVQNSSGRFQH